jgi:tRNA nucleotidyltransferase (CCA-adding enzyme)
LAALAHDLGKALTTREQPDGRITSHGHAKAGMPLVDKLLHRITAQTRIIEHVKVLVKSHMRPLQLAQAPVVTDAAIRRLARDIQPSNLAMLARPTEADAAATRHASGGGKLNPHVFLMQRAASLGVSQKPPQPILLGRDLIRMAKSGRLPEHFRRGGPHFKAVLDKVFDAQIEGKISSREDAENLAVKIISEGRM